MLSIAMIVKNEKRNLPRLLKSIKPLIDAGAELVIVDTGSTDGTQELAMAATRRVYHQSWTGNFSIHRNYSFKKCRGDWILGIDADEQFCTNTNIDTLFKFLTALPDEINTISLQVKDIRANTEASASDSIRFFRKGSTVWTRAIHNRPEFSGGTVMYPAAHIRHYGYDLTPEQAKIKAERTISALKIELEKDPNNYDSIFYLAQAYAVFANDEINALLCAEEYIAKRDAIKDFNPSIYYLAINAYLRKKDLDAADAMLKIAMGHVPASVDILWTAIQYGVRTSNPGYVAAAATQFVAAYKQIDNFKIAWPGCFLFTHHPRYLAQALYYMAMSHFDWGSTALKELTPLLSQIPVESKAEIEKNIRDCFKNLDIATKAYPAEKSKIILPPSMNYGGHHTMGARAH